MVEEGQMPVYRTDWFVTNTIAIDNVDHDINDWATEVFILMDGETKIMKIKAEKREQYLDLERNALPDYKRIKLNQVMIYQQ